MKTPTLLCWAFLFSTLPIFRATAAQGFFSPDGKTVTMVFNGKLATVDIPSGKFSPIELPPAFDDVDEQIHSVAKGGKGEILFLARDAVWSLKSGEAPQKLCSTVPLLGPRDLFVVTQADSPWTDWLFVSAAKEGDPFHDDRVTFRALKPGGDSFGSIFCHRVDNAVAGCFTPDGRFFFSSSGDLWEGGIADTPTDKDHLGELIAARIAPLATRNADASYGGLGGVNQVATAGNWIYASISGRHCAAIVRTPLPDKVLVSPTTGWDASVTSYYQAMRNSLNKVEIITEPNPDDSENLEGFCVCEVKGKPLVFYAAHSAMRLRNAAVFMLWEGSGAPRVIGHGPLPPP